MMPARCLVPFGRLSEGFLSLSKSAANPTHAVCPVRLDVSLTESAANPSRAALMQEILQRRLALPMVDAPSHATVASAPACPQRPHALRRRIAACQSVIGLLQFDPATLQSFPLRRHSGDTGLPLSHDAHAPSQVSCHGQGVCSQLQFWLHPTKGTALPAQRNPLHTWLSILITIKSAGLPISALGHSRVKATNKIVVKSQLSARCIRASARAQVVETLSSWQFLLCCRKCHPVRWSIHYVRL